ncbi:MAG: alpha/beta fold hydrolase, partial [Desulfobulbales bacterium]
GWAGRNPDKIAGLIVMNTAAFRSAQIPLRIAICRWPVIGSILVRGLNLFARGATFMAVRKKMPPAIAAGFLYPYDSWANRVAVHRFIEDIPLREGHPSLPALLQVEKGLKSLTAKPMLICWGGRDFCFNAEFYSEWRLRFPAAECHYFANAGHYLLEDDFDAIDDEVKRFLRSIGSGK